MNAWKKKVFFPSFLTSIISLIETTVIKKKGDYLLFKDSKANEAKVQKPISTFEKPSIKLTSLSRKEEQRGRPFLDSELLK